MKNKGLHKVTRNGQDKYVPKNDFLKVYNAK